jgi:DNA-binding transcriptional LysR family regulator
LTRRINKTQSAYKSVAPQLTVSAVDRFQTIESFVRVANAGSFTKAARQLGLSRALISRRIIELEARLGVRLLNRSTRSVSLTAGGALI